MQIPSLEHASLAIFVVNFVLQLALSTASPAIISITLLTIYNLIQQFALQHVQMGTLEHSGIVSVLVCYVLEIAKLAWRVTERLFARRDFRLISYTIKCVSWVVQMVIIQIQLLTCAPCNEACAVCSGPLNTPCSSCKNGYYFYLNASSSAVCLSSCPEGYFGSYGVNQCIPCFQSCRTCIGTTNLDCISCKSGYFLQPSSSKCLSTCPGRILQRYPIQQVQSLPFSMFDVFRGGYHSVP